MPEFLGKDTNHLQSEEIGVLEQGKY